MNYLQNYLYNYLDDVYGLLIEYVDAEYGLWLTWLLTPLFITFLLPAVLIVLIYTSAIIFHVYRLYRLRLVEGVQGDWRNAARLAVCALWDAHGWLWHGYEISGLENIPDGPCLIIYYHGALPVDMYYFIARMFLLRRIMVHTVADRFMFRIPGWSIMLDGLCVIPGTVQTCTNLLRAGNRLAISPGGVYEAQFGDHHYELKWKSRIGFAKVALEAKVPIVPMFTQNVREAFRTVGWLRWVWLRIYQATHIPLAPVYGGFPVKLVTHLGAPIQYDATLTPQQLQLKVARAIEDLVDQHQRVPGSILRALIERVYRLPKKPDRPADKQKNKLANGSCANGRLPAIRDNAKTDTLNKEIKQSEKYVNRKEDEKKTDNRHSNDKSNDMTEIINIAKEESVNGVRNAENDVTAVKDSPKDDKDDLTEVKDTLTEKKDSLAEDKDFQMKVKNSLTGVGDASTGNKDNLTWPAEKDNLSYVKQPLTEDEDSLTDVKANMTNVSTFKEHVSDSKMKVS